MIKRLKHIYIFALIVGLPASLYMFVYATNVEQPRMIESNTVATSPATPIVAAPTKPVTLAESSKTVKPVVKKAPVKKKVVKKKAKKKEKLTIAPALITPQTAPHTGR